METVKIGEHVLPVVPQRHARLRHRLSADDFQAILTKDYGRETYRVLGILIPALPERIPEWEWEGYASEEAMVNDEYVEDLDKGPTTADIVNAFETALRVSGAGRLGKIIELVQMGQRLGDQAAVARAQTTTVTPPSPVSPGENGESA
jgi:hypothetical protein